MKQEQEVGNFVQLLEPGNRMNNNQDKRNTLLHDLEVATDAVHRLSTYLLDLTKQAEACLALASNVSRRSMKKLSFSELPRFDYLGSWLNLRGHGVSRRLQLVIGAGQITTQMLQSRLSRLDWTFDKKNWPDTNVDYSILFGVNGLEFCASPAAQQSTITYELTGYNVFGLRELPEKKYFIGWADKYLGGLLNGHKVGDVVCAAPHNTHNVKIILDKLETLGWTLYTGDPLTSYKSVQHIKYIVFHIVNGDSSHISLRSGVADIDCLLTADG